MDSLIVNIRTLKSESDRRMISDRLEQGTYELDIACTVSMSKSP